MRRFLVGLAIFALVVPAAFVARADDRDIARHIVTRLQEQKDNGNLQGFNIDLQIDQGAVYLKGFVSNRQQLKLAIDIARRTEGVRQVFNEIEIKSEDGAREAPQARTAANGLAKLLLTSRRVEQSTEETAAADERQPAETMPAADVLLEEGADAETDADADTDVEHRDLQALQVSAVPLHTAPPATPHAPLTSREIAEGIVAQFQAEKQRGNLQGFGIDVRVENGVVWLEGRVSNPEQEMLAVDIARHSRGVTQVLNALTVEAPESNAVSPTAEESLPAAQQQMLLVAGPAENGSLQQPEMAISRQLAATVVESLEAKQAAGELANFGIDVQVDRRVVWMSGYVKDEHQQQIALDAARYTPGVEKVVNDLTIASHEEESVALAARKDEPRTLRSAPAAENQALSSAAVGQLAGQAGQQSQAIVHGAAATSHTTAVPRHSNGSGASHQLQSAPTAPYWQYTMVPVQYVPAQQMQAYQNQTPRAFAPARPVNYTTAMQPGQPVPVQMNSGGGVGIAPARFDHPQLPGYAWPSYAAHPNYGAVTYPKQYSAAAWPYIGPFYPYPQVPLGWRRVTLEWDDGWWQLKFKNHKLY